MDRTTPMDAAEQVLGMLREPGAHAPERILEALYRELRSHARSMLRRERGDHTLQATALVNEAWLRVAQVGGEAAVADLALRRAFVARATTAMRRILVEHARRRGALRRGGGDWRRVTVSGVGTDSSEIGVIEIHDALGAVAVDRPRLARFAELRLFGGLSSEEAGAALGLSTTAAKDEWALARAVLARALRDGPAAASRGE